jgi:hypothetical protein
MWLWRDLCYDNEWFTFSAAHDPRLHNSHRMQDREPDTLEAPTRANADFVKAPRPANSGDQMGGFAKGLAVTDGADLRSPSPKLPN